MAKFQVGDIVSHTISPKVITGGVYRPASSWEFIIVEVVQGVSEFVSYRCYCIRCPEGQHPASRDIHNTVHMTEGYLSHAKI